MLKNKIIVKKIRNIFILFMAIIIMFGAYKNIKNSRAENVIEVDMEVADQSNSLEVQTITVDAIEKKTGNYVLELPTSVNGLIVSKYYTSSGSEIDMANENADKTIKLTNDEITNKKIQISTDYDKKDATTVETMDSENKVTATLYNKELMSAGDENGAGEGDVVVTGYMPLDAKLEVANIDLATLTSVKMSDKNQTMQKAYEISIYQKETEDAEKTEYNSSIYGETLEIKTKNLQGGTAGTIYRLPDETPTQASTGAETGNVITADMVSKVIANTTTEAMKQTIATENIQDQEYLDFAASKTSNTIKYIIATEPKTTEETNSNETAADETSNDESNIMTTATTESSNWVKASSIFESGTSSGSGKLHIGDFVNYDAGTWTQAEINNIKTGLTTGKVTANGSVNRPSSNFQFGGFAAGNSRNGNATPWTFTASNVTYGGYIKDASTGSALTGWRVFDVDGDTVTLISAGNPEDYFHPDSTYAYASEYILTGNINSSWSSTEAAKYTKRDWSNYVNSILNATSATVLSKSRLDTWFSKYISSGANTATAATYQKIYASPYTRYQNILDNYAWYYLPTSYNARSLYYSNSQYRNINYYSNYAFGVRVLVTLSSDAKFSSTRTGTKTVTGGNTSTYGGNQTYNVWGIQQK